jgi:hypothetical protein
MIANLLSGLAIVVSGLTLWLTIYYQFLKRASVAIVVDNDVTAYYTSARAISFDLKITFLNEGAQPGVVVRLIGTLTSFDGKRTAKLSGIRFFKNSNVSQNYRRVEEFVVFDGRFEPFVVPERGAVYRIVGVTSDDEYLLTPGGYVLELATVTGAKQETCKSLPKEFVISKENEHELMTNCLPTGAEPPRSTLGITLQKQAKRH